MSTTANAAKPAPPKPDEPLSLRPPRLSDGAAMHQLVKRCPPLDVNTPYAYFLLADHFGSTCCVAELGGAIAGLVTGYRPPKHPDALFVWQVAVGEEARGRSLAGRMILDILMRPENSGVRWIHTTVGPTNEPSRRLFQSVARKLGARIAEESYIDERAFPGGGHESEPLLRIGPFENSLKS